MIRYETLFLTVPEITADEASAIESQLEKVVKENDGALLAFDRWGKYRLAYPIRKNDYGIYFLARIEASEAKLSSLLDALRTFFAVKYNDLVMRHLTVRMDNKSLEYQRPDSLEDAPARDIDVFLKENKMTGLLNKSGRRASQEVAAEAQEVEADQVN